MITPRRTRLVRVPDTHAFRQTLVELAVAGGAARVHSRLVVVPTRGAARQLRRTIEHARQGVESPALVTRDELYDLIGERTRDLPRRLTAYEREVIMESAARTAPRDEPRDVRPSVVAEMIRFYDQLRRQGRHVRRFEELIEEVLAADADTDRGAGRMLAQTRWLAESFRGYEKRVTTSGGCDEHGLRERLLAAQPTDTARDIVVAVGDWIADPSGLYLADFDLLTRLPGVETVDVVATEHTLAAGFHQRVHDWLPGIEEVREAGVPEGAAAAATFTRPVLLVPPGDAEQLAFTVRDREEELIAIARRITSAPAAGALDRLAVVYKHPLPYLYLARDTFGSAHLPYDTSDALPLATEPFAAALDLVLEFIESGFARPALVALLRSPHFSFGHDGPPISSEAIAALDRGLSQKRYLGGADRLAQLAASWRSDAAVEAPAAEAGRRAAERLSPLLTPAAASAQLRSLLSFVEDHLRPSVGDDGDDSRSARARAAILGSLDSLARAHADHDDGPMAIGGLAASVRRWIGEQTFEPEPSHGGGIQLVDDQAARYGDFDEIAVVGLIEHEWPERPSRNIFYPSALLTALGWPPETDRRAAADARFLDLLQSASREVSVWTITLDDDALVEPATLIDDISRAGLTTMQVPLLPPEDAETSDATSAANRVGTTALDRDAGQWAAIRASRSSAADARFHGSVGGPPPSSRPGWSISALETYLGCPFRFFARYVLRLEEEPEDEEVMDPRTQGEFMHEVFQAFFERWQADGHQAITPDNLEIARAVFAEVAEGKLTELSDTEAALERTRLMGSPAAAGLAEAVLRMEAERPIPVVGRHLELELKGEFTFESDGCQRSVTLRGKADRVDLLADGTFRLIDYKLGWPPQKNRALQLPIYGLCAEQRLNVPSVPMDPRGDRGRRWTLGEAAYLAFKGPRRVVQLFGSSEDRADVLADAQRRLIATVDAIDAGEFPPRPDDVHRCETCSYGAVCRKEYVD